MTATATRQTQQPASAAFKTLADQIIENTVEYKPFMQQQSVKLSVSVVRKYLCQPTRSGKQPSDADCINFIMLCRARGLNPFEGDAFLLGYDTKDWAKFSLITAHQALLKRAEVNPHYDGMESGIVIVREQQDESGELQPVLLEVEGDLIERESDRLIGGWARVHRKDRKIPTYRRVKLDTYSTGQSRWAKDPAGMIVKVAEADALRSTFPTTVGSMYIEQEFGFQMPTPDQIIDATAAAAPIAPGRTVLRNGNGRRKEEAPPAPVEEVPVAAAPMGDDDPLRLQLLDELKRLGIEGKQVADWCAKAGGRWASLTQEQGDKLLKLLAEAGKAGDAAE